MSSATTSMTERDKKQRRVGLSLTVVAACLYLPFSWLLVTENNWSDYRLFWLKLWTILPGLIPSAFLFHPNDVAEFIAMGVTTLLLLVGLTWLGSLGWKRLLAAAVIALLISIPSSMVAHSFYWF
ncbi:MAG: Uncharacterized protein FD138_1726 [Planctomycetota bacterium]|nr:MAG: Uncharacterized protein FD138_1726 [Planctomycetota bacterium]